MIMKKLLIFSILVSALNATQTINYDGEIQNIKLSKNSWNRLIFDSDINAEPIYSKEKNIDIYKANKSVFIKFKPMLKVEILDKKESILDVDYDKSKKSELFISTKNSTYSFTIEPIQSDAKTYLIQNNQMVQKDILKFEIDPIRKILKNITKAIYLNEEVPYYKKISLSKKMVLIDDLKIKTKYMFEGKIYRAYMYEVTALKDRDNKINTNLFLQMDVKNKKSISLKDEVLSKDQRTTLIIVVGK